MNPLPEPLVLTRIQSGWDLFMTDYVAAARTLWRDPDRRERLFADRRRAVAAHPMPLAVREVHLAQVERSRSALCALGRPGLQQHAGTDVPLLADAWLRGRPLPGGAVAAAADVLRGLGLPYADALSSIAEPPGGGPAARVARTADGFEILFADDGSGAALAVLLHEVGHYLYETAPGAAPEESFRRYVESEAAALALGRVGFAAHLAATAPDDPEPPRLWSRYCDAEAWLNHYYLLTEAAELGLCQAPGDALGMVYLRDTYSTSVGYQVVYALASSLIADAPERVVERLAAGADGGGLLPPRPGFDDLTRLA